MRAEFLRAPACFAVVVAAVANSLRIEALEVEALEVEGLGGSIGDLGSGEYFCGGARFECSGA